MLNEWIFFRLLLLQLFANIYFSFIRLISTSFFPVPERNKLQTKKFSGLISENRFGIFFWMKNLFLLLKINFVLSFQ